MDIFQMSFTGAALIITIIIVRALVLRKLPKKTFLFLWGVAICRLLIPFSLPSPFSVYTGLDRLKQVVTQTAALTTPVEATDISFMGAVSGVENVTGTPSLTATVSPIMVIWLVGTCSCALFFIVAYIKSHREFLTSLPVENDFIDHCVQEHFIRRIVQIRQSDRINTPLTYGIFQPVVLIPKKTDWMDEERLQFILAHEFVHIRHFDALTKLLLTSVVCIHWFNPLVWVMYILANRDIELSCDETVVRIFGETMKSAYALMLIDMEEKKNKLAPLCSNFNKNAIEERIVSIMKMKKTSLVGTILALTLVIGITTVFATSATAEKLNSLKIVGGASKDIMTEENKQYFSYNYVIPYIMNVGPDYNGKITSNKMGDQILRCSMNNYIDFDKNVDTDFKNDRYIIPQDVGDKAIKNCFNLESVDHSKFSSYDGQKKAYIIGPISTFFLGKGAIVCHEITSINQEGNIVTVNVSFYAFDEGNYNLDGTKKINYSRKLEALKFTFKKENGRYLYKKVETLWQAEQ